MQVYILKKEKGKKYESKSICSKVLGFELEYEKDKPLGCSISDTGHFWACAVGCCGLDIEEKTRRLRASTAKALTAPEQEYLSVLSAGSSEWSSEFLHIWTVKEAIFKLTGLRFKEISALDGDMSYKKELRAAAAPGAEPQSFNILHFEDGALTGCLISPDDSIEIKHIVYAGESAKPCMDCAADFLSRRAYSCAELSKKLRGCGYGEEELIACLAALTELGYIDDASYAARYAENAYAAGKGYSYIRQRLALAGIDRELVPEPDREAELEVALKLALSMEGGNAQRIARRLAARGFSVKIVYDVLARLRERGII